MLLAIDVAAKGLLVLGSAIAIIAVLRRHSAATRYLVWSTAIGSLLVLPVLALMVPALVVPVVPEPWLAAPAPSELGAPLATPSPMASAPRPTPRAPVVLAPLAGERSAGALRPDPTPAGESRLQALSPSLQGPALLDWFAMPAWPTLLAGVYLLGVLAVLAYVAVGVRRVARTLYEARTVADERLIESFDLARLQLGVRRPVRLLESDATFVPIVWEMFRPTVLLPAGAAAWSGDRIRVVMQHELAHVKRRDCQVQLLAYAALALHWFNPLAWLAVRRLRIEREHACDDQVVRLGTRATDYADHLLQITRGLLPPSEPESAALAMARSSNLETRVAAILDPRNPRRLPDRRKTMIVAALTLVLLLPLAALQPGALAEGATLPPLPFTTAGGSSAAAPASQDAEPSLDDLVQMRIHGVTPDFIQEVRDALGRPVTVRELVQMRIHGASIEYVREMRELLGDDLSVNNITQMRIHGASTEYVRGIRDMLGDDVSINNITQMRIHGASIEYVREMRELLGDDLSVNDITQMRIHGASTEYVREMRELLGDDLSVNSLTQMRIHGASARYVRTMQELLPDEELTVRDVTQMCIHGVSIDLVRELQEEGFDELTVNDLVQMKIHGFDRWLRRRGGRS